MWLLVLSDDIFKDDFVSLDLFLSVSFKLFDLIFGLWIPIFIFHLVEHYFKLTDFFLS